MTLLRRSWLQFLSLTLQGVAFAQLHEVGDGSFGAVKAAHVTAELKAGNPASSPDGDTNVALVLQLESGWHVYWMNAGDAGKPPWTEWITPAGVTVGPMQFLTPKRLPVGPLMDYGYEGMAVFPFAVKRSMLLRSLPRRQEILKHTFRRMLVGWFAAKFAFPERLSWE